MAPENFKNFVLLFLSALSIVAVPAVEAHVAVYDEYWTQRQAEALNQTLKSYEPNPLNVTNHLNHHVALAVGAHNGTRRELLLLGKLLKGRRSHFKGQCQATNPIDKCWRCDPNWDKNRQKLADCGLGFGRRAIGGKGGPIYVVTDASDDNLVNPRPGTLRHAVTRIGPLWIIFAQSMIIKLQQELIITSDKTIDGRGVNVQIRDGAGLTLQFVRNVIIHNIHVHDIVPGSGGMIMDSENHVGIRTQSDGDGISLFGASDIWIDHVSMSKCSDGMIDAIQGSTGVTISNFTFEILASVCVGDVVWGKQP